LRRFEVVITDPRTGASETDERWESCVGGGVNLTRLESPERGTTSPGHKFVDVITLRGPLTAGRKALLAWLTEAAQGADARRDVTIRETARSGAVRTFNYHDCFPVRYVFPEVTAAGAGVLYEEVQIKPERLELK
jgi:hypothetical protein